MQTYRWQVAVRLMVIFVKSGIHVETDGTRVRYRPKRKISPFGRELVKACKTELITMLNEGCWN